MTDSRELPPINDRRERQLLHFAGDRPVRRAPVDGDAPAGAIELAEAGLVAEPGTVVRWGDVAWRLEAPGRYAFLKDMHVQRNVIVDGGDLAVFCRAFAQIHEHGYRHNGESYEKLIERACTGRISASCNFIGDVLVEFFRRRGERARRVQVWTRHEQTGLSDGHAIWEYFDRPSGRWVLADVDLHAFFHDPASGRRLNAFEVWSFAQRGERPGIERMSRLGTCDSFGPGVDESGVSLLTEQIYVDDDALWANYCRLGSFLGIQPEDETGDGYYGVAYFPGDDPADEPLVTRHTDEPDRYRFLPRAEWLAKFYPASA